MKENLKWAIIGASIIAAVGVYVLGTRYQGVVLSGSFGSNLIIYDKITGIRK